MAENTSGRRVARAAGTVMLAYLLVQAVGILRTILISRAFGTSAELDSFNAANRVAEMLFNLVAGGALGSAFIPTFTGLLARGQRERAWKLAAAVANLLLLVLSAVSLLAALFAPQIVRHGLFILAPGQESGQIDLTVRLLRLLLPSVVIFGLSGLAMGTLNAHQRFWLPAIAPALYNLGQILGLLLLPPAWGVARVAWGVILGAALHLLVQLPALVRLPGRRYTLTLGAGLAEVREVILLMGPRVLGVAVVQINFLANTIIALSLPEGSVSAVALGLTMMLMPQAALAQSTAVAVMPTFSAQAALGKLDELRATLAGALRGVLLLAIPASLGLILLRQPLIALLYQHGPSFDAESTAMVAWALLWYTAGLVGHSLLEVIVRAFYALKDTRTPVMVGAGAMALNVGFSFLFSALFSRLGWMPHGGLALANTLATALEVTLLLFLLRRRLAGLGGRGILRAAGQALLAAAGMGALLWLGLAWGAALPDAVLALGGAALGGLVYAALVLALRVPEARGLLGSLERKLNLSPRPPSLKGRGS